MKFARGESGLVKFGLGFSRGSSTGSQFDGLTPSAVTAKVLPGGMLERRYNENEPSPRA